MKNTSFTFPTTHLHLLQLTICSVSMNLGLQAVVCVVCWWVVFFFNLLYIRDHSVVAFLCFISLTMMPTRSIHVGANGKFHFLSVQFSSVAQSCPTLHDPMDCSRPGFPVHRQPSELVQTHIHWVGDAIQPSHLLSSPSPPTFNLSQHQGFSKWVSSLYQVAKVLEFQLQHQFFQWTFSNDFL